MVELDFWDGEIPNLGATSTKLRLLLPFELLPFHTKSKVRLLPLILIQPTNVGKHCKTFPQTNPFPSVIPFQVPAPQLQFDGYPHIQAIRQALRGGELTLESVLLTKPYVKPVRAFPISRLRLKVKFWPSPFYLSRAPEKEHDLQ